MNIPWHIVVPLAFLAALFILLWPSGRHGP